MAEIYSNSNDFNSGFTLPQNAANSIDKESARLRREFKLEALDLYYTKALKGDENAARELYYRLNEIDRVQCLNRLLIEGANKKTLRIFTKECWGHEHEPMTSLLGRAGVKDAFIRSGFEIPDHVPETLVIYRGGYGVSQRVLARGFSWSTDKPTACWFSTRYADIAGPRKYRHHYKKSIDPELGPLVVEAKIHRDEIVCWDPGDREENEVFLFGAKGSKISGDVDEWNLLAEEQTARIRLMHSGLVQSASDAA